MFPILNNYGICRQPATSFIKVKGYSYTSLAPTTDYYYNQEVHYTNAKSMFEGSPDTPNDAFAAHLNFLIEPDKAHQLIIYVHDLSKLDSTNIASFFEAIHYDVTFTKKSDGIHWTSGGSGGISPDFNQWIETSFIGTGLPLHTEFSLLFNTNNEEPKRYRLANQIIKLE